MLINKNLMAVRRLPNAIRRLESLRRENEAAVIVGWCMTVGALIITAAVIVAAV